MHPQSHHPPAPPVSPQTLSPSNFTPPWASNSNKGHSSAQAHTQCQPSGPVSRDGSALWGQALSQVPAAASTVANSGCVNSTSKSKCPGLNSDLQPHPPPPLELSGTSSHLVITVRNLGASLGHSLSITLNPILSLTSHRFPFIPPLAASYNTSRSVSSPVPQSILRRAPISTVQNVHKLIISLLETDWLPLHLGSPRVPRLCPGREATTALLCGPEQ